LKRRYCRYTPKNGIEKEFGGALRAASKISVYHDGALFTEYVTNGTAAA